MRLLESRDLLGVCYRLRKLPKAKPEQLSSAPDFDRGGSNRSELIYSRYQPPPALSSPSSPLQLRPYYISDVPPFFQPQLSSQPPPVDLLFCLSFSSPKQPTPPSLQHHTPPRTSRSLHTLLSKRVVGRGKQKPAMSPHSGAL